jgi:hypothetical protein
MANELICPLAPVTQTGLTVVARLFAGGAQVGADIAMTEIGSTAVYVGSMAGAANTYGVAFYDDSAGDLLGTGDIDWDGSAEVTGKTISDDVALIEVNSLTAQEVRDAMKLAPTAGSPAASSVDAELDTLLARTAAAVTVTVVSPVAPDGTTLDLVKSDDYTSGVDGRPVTIDVLVSSVEFADGDITSVALLVRDAQSDTALFTVTGSHAAAVNDDALDVIRLTFNLATTDTDGLTHGKGTALFDVLCVLSDATRVKVVTDGDVNVTGA